MKRLNFWCEENREEVEHEPIKVHEANCFEPGALVWISGEGVLVLERYYGSDGQSELWSVLGHGNLRSWVDSRSFIRTATGVDVELMSAAMHQRKVGCQDQDCWCKEFVK